MAPVLRTFVSPEEVYPGRSVSYEELVRIASGINRTEGVKYLGVLNLLLSAATTETHFTNRLEPVRDVQTHILRNVLSATLLRDLQSTFKRESLLDRPLLHRTQLMFAIRLVATHGLEDGGNRLEERGDFDVIGDLLFLVNGLFRVEPPTSKAAEALWVATQMGPMHETENPPNVELTWPQLSDLLMRRLPAAASDPSEMLRLEQVTIFTTGFNLQQWLDLTWLLFAFWSERSFAELIADMGRAYLDLKAPHEVVSNEILTRAVGGLGVPFADLPERLRLHRFTRETLFDLTEFRTKPLWIMPDGLVLCVDAGFLLERMGPHAFFSVMNALDGRERRREFSGVWGLGFETYALDAFEQMCHGKKWTYVRNPRDGRNDELADGFARRSGSAIVIECKGTFVATAEKYSGVPRRFFRGLTRKFGRVKHGGVHQLTRALSALWFRRTVPIPSSDDHPVTDVFPILVVQDPIFSCGPVVRVLSDRCQVGIERARRSSRKVRGPKVWPLTIMTADDLDRAAAVVATTGHPLDLILKRFHRVHPSRAVCLSEFLTSPRAGDMGLSNAAGDLLRSRLQSTTDEAMRRFREKEYQRNGTDSPCV